MSHSENTTNDKNNDTPYLLKTLTGHVGEVRSLVISPKGDSIISITSSDGIKIWSIETGLCIDSFKLKGAGVPWDIQVTPDSQQIVVGSLDKTVKIINLAVKKHVNTFKGHTAQVFSVAISSGGKMVAAGAKDGDIKVWDLTTGTCLSTLIGHTCHIDTLIFTADNKKVISGSRDSTLKIWNLSTNVNTNKCLATLRGHNFPVLALAITPDERTLITGASDSTLKVWSLDTGYCQLTLEGHIGAIYALAVSPDGKVVVSGSYDHTIKAWEIETGQCLTTLKSHNGNVNKVNITPNGQKIISCASDQTLKIWDLQAILDQHSPDAQIRYTTAKLVLVGDSGVGKTGLGWRLAHNEFKEHASTHGQQFWVIDDLGKTRDDGTECEAVLWDLAGQPDYRLVHSLFLNDIDTALVLFDPTNRQEPLAGVDFWLNQLKHKNQSLCKTILVGARTDRGTATLTQSELKEYCKRNDICGGYIATCAFDGNGIDQLLSTIKTQLPWQTMSATVTTLTFKRIKDYVMGLKEQTGNNNVLVSPEHLFADIQATDTSWQFSRDEMMTAVGHLQNHGYVTLLYSSNGAQSILLANDLLVNLASSMVLAARNHPESLGVLEAQRVLTNDYKFNELHGLEADERDILQDAATALFLQRNVCFTELVGSQSLLVFPSLINEKRPANEQVNLVEGASYQVKGAIENVYASLVVQLGYTNTITRTAQWQNQAQYEMGKKQICGFSQNDRGNGEIELVIYYDKTTRQSAQTLFQALFEHMLNSQALDVFRYLPIICSNKDCHEQLPRAVVMERLKSGKDFCFCNECGTKQMLPSPAPLTQLEQ